jgi:hypothetical protein
MLSLVAMVMLRVWSFCPRESCHRNGKRTMFYPAKQKKPILLPSQGRSEADSH